MNFNIAFVLYRGMSVQKRLAKAREEMKFLDRFKYIVTNDDLDKAVESVKALIMVARNDFVES